jgi:hypothetical protein
MIVRFAWWNRRDPALPPSATATVAVAPGIPAAYPRAVGSADGE